jgi:putative peptide zinc metalloprotease protein
MPRLATDVLLLGEMPETGFREPQWLARRGAGHVQLTELLYRVLELADGTRTVRDLAAQIAASSRWAVSADDVRHLVEERLRPAGLIDCGGPGEPPPRPIVTSTPSLTRAMVLGPHLVNPVGGALSRLFAGPVVVCALALVVAARWWLYGGHDLASAVRHVLYTPGMLLALVGLVLVASLAHELGHASALRRGGGRVGSIGIGVYLFFPVFYTDVSDSYRLGRRARVRTDLGGFYFHLLVTLVATGLYALTGAAPFAVLVLLIDFDIVRQSLPFIRFDGYWALADLTGVPDPLSQATPFLKSAVSRLRRLPGPRLPALKGWVRAVFMAYLVLSVPVLGGLAYLFVRYAPAIASTLWDAVASQAGELRGAAGRGDVALVLSSLTQIVIIGVECAALAFCAVRLVGTAGRLARAPRNWPGRVAAGGLVAVLVTGIVLLWIP